MREQPGDPLYDCDAKRMGFSDREIAVLWDMTEEEIFQLRTDHGIVPGL